MKSFRIAVVVAALIGLWAAPPLMGAIKSKMKLTVLNSQGQPLAGAVITLQDTQSTYTGKLTTDKKGVATHGTLDNHVYIITVELAGYQGQRRQVKVPAFEIAEEEFKLLTPEEAILLAESSDPDLQAVNRFNKAVLLIKKDDLAGAVPLLQEAIQSKPDMHQAHLELGHVFFLQAKYQEAIAPLKKVAELSPDYPETYRLLAAIYEKLGDAKESEKFTLLAQQKGGFTAIDKYNEGIKAFNAGDMDSAIAALAEAVQKDAKLADGFYQLGMAYLNKGRTNEALFSMKKFLELEPTGEKADSVRSIIQLLEKK